jgi:MFS family permease
MAPNTVASNTSNSGPERPVLATATNTRPPLFTPAFVLVLAVQLLYGTAYSTMFILPKYLLETRAASATLIGNAHGVYAVAGAVAVAFVGPWLDQWGRRPVMLLGLVLGIFTYAPFGWATSTAALLSLRALHGVGFAMVFSAGSALAVDLAPASRRAEAVGYFGTAMLITNGFGPAIAEFLSVRVSWSAVFVGCSLYTVCALVPALLLREAPRPPAARTGNNYAVPLSWPLAGGYLAMFAIGIGVGVSKTFIPSVLVTEGAARVAPYFVTYTAGALVQRTVFGWVPDRMGRLRATVAALGLYAAVLLATAPAGLPWIVGLSFALGVAHGGAYPAATAMTADLSTAQNRGRSTAWAAGFFNLGFGVAATGLARLDFVVGYRGMIAIGGGLLAASALLIPRWVRAVVSPRTAAEVG